MMANCKEARVTLTNTKINKLIAAAKNKTKATVKITNKNSEDEELSHELVLTKRKGAKVRNTFTNNMLTEIKLSPAELPKVIQSDRFPGNTVDNQDKKSTG